MRIAIYAADINERYALSRLSEEALLRRGVLPEIVLFPVLYELIEASFQNNAFDLAVIQSDRSAEPLKRLCERAPVILIGGKESGPAAFDMGAEYFIEAPADSDHLNRALTRCLQNKSESYCGK